MQAAPLGRENAAASDLVRLSQDNPQAAVRICEGLAQQARAALSEIERELAGTRATIDKLAKERFAKDARDKVASTVRREREKIAALKKRYQTATRKMALLQQIAGRLGHSRLEEEIERLLGQHAKFRTDWGRRYHLLGMGESLFGDNSETPEHLREVTNSEVLTGAFARRTGEVLQAVSPQSAMSELIARTLDGTARDEVAVPKDALCGELGRSAESFAMLSVAVEESLGKDPIKRGR